MLLKIFGERNTGTNYLEQLLVKNIAYLPPDRRDNFTVVFSDVVVSHEKDLKQLGWKHRYIDPAFLQECQFTPDSGLIITLTKNPYSWLLSMHKRPYADIHLRQDVFELNDMNVPHKHRDCNIITIRNLRKYGRFGKLILSHFPQWSEYERIEFRDFIRAKWFTQFNEGCPAKFSNPIKLWNVKNKAYLNLPKPYKVLSLTYENLLTDPENIVRQIFASLNINLLEFHNITSAAKKEDKAAKDHDYYKKYYLNEMWREKLSSKDIRWISSQLDPEVMHRFGYNFI